MTSTLMKNKLLEKFDAFSISQAVYLHTRRTTDIDELTKEELEKLYSLFFPKQPSAEEKLMIVQHNDLIKRYKSNILTIATRIGIKEPDSWEAFNRFMLSSSILKKKLNDYSLEELKDLEIQFRAMQVNYDRSSLKVGTKAWYHKNKLIPPSNN